MNIKYGVVLILLINFFAKSSNENSKINLSASENKINQDLLKVINVKSIANIISDYTTGWILINQFNKIRKNNYIDGSTVDEDDDVHAMSLSYDNKYLAVAYYESLALWNLVEIAKGKCSLIKEIELGPFTSSLHNIALSFSDNNKYLAVSDGTNLKILTLGDLSVTKKIALEEDIRALKFSENDKYLIAIGSALIKLEISYKVINNNFLEPEYGSLTSAFSKCNNYVAFADGPNIKILDLTNQKDNPYGKVLKLILGDNIEEKYNMLVHPIQSLTFSDDGKYLAAGSRNKTLKIYDADSNSKDFGSLFKNIEDHKDCVSRVAFSKNCKFLASGSGNYNSDPEDTSIKIWDVSDIKNKNFASLIQTLDGHGASVSSLIFSYDNKYLFVGYKDGVVKIWRYEGIDL